MKKGDFVKTSGNFIGIVVKNKGKSTLVTCYNGISIVSGWWAKECLTLIPQDELLKILSKPCEIKRQKHMARVAKAMLGE